MNNKIMFVNLNLLMNLFMIKSKMMINNTIKQIMKIINKNLKQMICNHNNKKSKSLKKMMKKNVNKKKKLMMKRIMNKI